MSFWGFNRHEISRMELIRLILDEKNIQVIQKLDFKDFWKFLRMNLGIFNGRHWDLKLSGNGQESLITKSQSRLTLTSTSKKIFLQEGYSI